MEVGTLLIKSIIRGILPSDSKLYRIVVLHIYKYSRFPLTIKPFYNFDALLNQVVPLDHILQLIQFHLQLHEKIRIIARLNTTAGHWRNIGNTRQDPPIT